VKSDTIVRLSVFGGLVAAGAVSRIWFHELPNFAPIAAMALFSGYYFRSAKVAVLVPLLAMSLSDLVIGSYDWQVMAVVYAALALPVAFRGLLQKHLSIERGSARSASLGLGGLLTCSLASSLFFFIATNFACWCFGNMYEHNGQGLLLCYLQGLPFFRFTLAGDLFFGALLFGSYAAALNFGWAKSVQPIAVAAGSK
jgi:hypothetical protein